MSSYDINGISPFIIEFDSDNNGALTNPATWTHLATYATNPYNEWAPITMFNHHQSIRRLKFTKTKRVQALDAGSIGKIVFCGRTMTSLVAGEGGGKDPEDTVAMVSESWVKNDKVALNWDAVTKIEEDGAIGYAEHYTVSYSADLDDAGEPLNPTEIAVEPNDGGAAPITVSTEIEDENISQEKFHVIVRPCICPSPNVNDEDGVDERSSTKGWTGRQAEAAEAFLTLYPNPSSGSVTASWQVPGFQHLLLLDHTGRVARQVNIPAESVEHSLDVSALPEGVFILLLKGEGKAPLYAKLVIARD